MLHWRTLKSKIVYQNSYFKVRKNVVLLPTGEESAYSYVDTPNSVMIVALTSQGKVIFTHQYRYPNRKLFLELPGGGGKKGKSSLQVAREELEEETGFRAKKWKRIGLFATWSGMAREFCDVWLAKDLRKSTQRLEEREVIIKVIEIPGQKIFKMIDQGKIKDGLTLASLSLARQYLQ